MTDDPVPNNAPRQPRLSATVAEPRTLDAQELFQGANEICIRHAGVQYRLRITRRNRLILHR
jgi:hemin uptake protein HemP